jgi:EF hand
MHTSIHRAARTLCAVALLASASVLSATSSADKKDAVIVVAPTGPSQLIDSPRYDDRGFRRTSRYGVYYGPRYLVVPGPSNVDKFGNGEDEDEHYDEFDVADLNDDGLISMKEARRANPDWVRNFRRIDTDGDGYLTREELEAFYRPSAPTPRPIQ